MQFWGMVVWFAGTQLGTALAQDLSSDEAALVRAHQRRATDATRGALLGVADQRTRACMTAYDADDYGTALPSCSAALALTEAVVGPDHPDVADGLRVVARVLGRTQRHDEAIPIARRALAIVEAMSPPDLERLSGMLGDLATLLHDGGHLQEAVAIARRGLAIAEEHYGPDHPVVGARQDYLGSFLTALGRYEEAIVLEQRALANAETAFGPEDARVGNRMGDLAALLDDVGRYDEADRVFRRALAIQESAMGPDHPDVGYALNNYGNFLESTGRYQEAERALHRASAIAEATYGPEHPNFGASLSNLGNLLESVARYSEAESMYRRALRVVEQAHGSEHPSVGQVSTNLAVVLGKLGRHEEADRMYRRGLAIAEAKFGSGHPLVAASLNNLALGLDGQGRSDEAVGLLRRALAIVESRLGPKHPFLGTVATNLAGALSRDGGRAEDVAALYERARIIAEATVGPEHPRAAMPLINAGRALRQGHDIGGAADLYRRGLTRLEAALGADHPSVAVALQLLADVSLARGQAEDGLRLLWRSLDIEETALGETLFTGTREQRRLRLRQFEDSTSFAVSVHQQYLPDSEEAAKLALQTLLRRKGRLADLNRDTFELLRAHTDAEGLELLERYRRRVGRLGVLQSAVPADPRSLATWADERARLQEEIDDLERSLTDSSTEYRQVTEPVRIDRVALGQRTALLELAIYRPFSAKANRWGPGRYVAYLLHGDGHVASADLGPADALDARVRILRKALLTPQPGSVPIAPDVAAAARDLFEATLEPLWQELGGLEHLYVAPEGLLNLVPFDVLLAAGPADASRIKVSYLTSGRDLVHDTRVVPKPNRSVVVYDVDYDRAARPIPERLDQALATPWPALPGAAAEGRHVRRAVRGARSLTRDEATVPAIEALAHPRILHVASHGYFLSEDALPTVGANGDTPTSGELARTAVNPLLRSGIVLAGANLPPVDDDDGLLTSAELANLDLRGTALVVLSACETGRGEIRNGDGVLGLRRGLFLAGARAYVLSLWKVDDEATAALMRVFYRRLRRGYNVGDALRAAKDRIRSRARWSHPYFWAAFTTSGDANTTP